MSGTIKVMEKILYCSGKIPLKKNTLPVEHDTVRDLGTIAKKNHSIVVIHETALDHHTRMPASLNGRLCLLFFPEQGPHNIKITNRLGCFNYITGRDSSREIAYKLKQAQDFLLTRIHVSNLEAALKEKDKQIEDMVLIDPLTRCFNWRYFLHRMDEEMTRSRRHLHDLSVLGIDIDHFRQINELTVAILHKTPLSISGSEGRRAVELICACYESAASGKPIRLSS